jgi:hypothetical protein
MSSSAADQTHEGTVEHAADTIKKRNVESKGMNKIMFLELREESTSASLTATVLKSFQSNFSANRILPSSYL